MRINLNGTIKDFQYAVIKPKKFYNKIRRLQEYSNISYSQFNSRNVSFDIFEAAFLGVDSRNLINESQLDNIFEYLTNNLKATSDLNIKKIVIRIKKLRVELVEKLNNLSENDSDAIQNINAILKRLDILKCVMLDELKMKNKNIEDEIDFDMFMDELLSPEDFDTSNLLPTLFYNLPVLGNNVDNGKKFNERLYRVILRAIHEDNKEKKKYYIALANSIYQTNVYPLDRRVMNVCGFSYYSKNSTTKLNEKIKGLEYDNRRGRYRLDDFVVTIDNENTSKYDDAISVEKMADGSYILGIHIADVYSLGITPATPASIEAKSRASLKQNIDKNAISLFVEVSNTGLIVDRKILMTTINVNNNLLYDDVSKIFSNKSNDKLHQTVVDLIGLYNIVDNSKLPEFPGPSAIAHALVQKYMLLYGCVASKIATEKNYPILFNASDNKVSEVTLDEVHINTGFIDNNLTTYARFTSPIWDVRSFINQASICECILGRLDTIELKTWRQKMRGYGRTINKELRQRLKNYDTKRNGLQ